MHADLRHKRKVNRIFFLFDLVMKTECPYFVDNYSYFCYSIFICTQVENEVYLHICIQPIVYRSQFD